MVTESTNVLSNLPLGCTNLKIKKYNENKRGVNIYTIPTPLSGGISGLFFKGGEAQKWTFLLQIQEKLVVCGKHILRTPCKVKYG